MNRTHSKWNRGFTLLEVSIAIMIIALISGAIFSLVQGVIAVTTQVEYGWNRHQQIYRFSELMRSTLRELPNNAVIESKEEDWNGFPAPTLIIRGGTMDLGGASLLSGEWETVLQAREMRGGRVGLYLFQRPVEGTRTAVEYQETEAIQLLPDMIYVNWEFKQANSNDWLVEWRAGNQKPALIRIELIPIETEESQFLTYWLPDASNPQGNLNPRP